MDAIVNVRTTRQTKDRAQKVLSSMGMNTSAAVNMFLNQVVAEGKLPFTPSSRVALKKKK